VNEPTITPTGKLSGTARQIAEQRLRDIEYELSCIDPELCPIAVSLLQENRNSLTRLLDR
jgi:hypothetical protein